jgi:hypothetical protein
VNHARGAAWWWKWIVSPAVGVGLVVLGCAMGEPHDDSPNNAPTDGGRIVVTCTNGSERSDCKLS